MAQGESPAPFFSENYIIPVDLRNFIYYFIQVFHNIRNCIYYIL